MGDLTNMMNAQMDYEYPAYPKPTPPREPHCQKCATLRAELDRAQARVAELEGALESIYVYANDTLSGRVDGPDDRGWQRAAVAVCRNRARAALAKGGA